MIDVVSCCSSWSVVASSVVSFLVIFCFVRPDISWWCMLRLDSSSVLDICIAVSAAAMKLMWSAFSSDRVCLVLMVVRCGVDGSSVWCHGKTYINLFLYIYICMFVLLRHYT